MARTNWTEAGKKAWATRLARYSEEEMKATLGSAAKKAWATRKANEAAKAERLSNSAKKAWATRRAKGISQNV